MASIVNFFRSRSRRPESISPEPRRLFHDDPISSQPLRSEVIAKMSAIADGLHHSVVRKYTENGGDRISALVTDLLKLGYDEADLADAAVAAMKQESSEATQLEAMLRASEERREANTRQLRHAEPKRTCQDCGAWPGMCSCAAEAKKVPAKKKAPTKKPVSSSESDTTSDSSDSSSADETPRKSAAGPAFEDSSEDEEAPPSFDDLKTVLNARKWEYCLEHDPQGSLKLQNQLMMRYSHPYQAMETSFSTVLNKMLFQILLDIWIRKDYVLATQRVIRVLEGVYMKMIQKKNTEQMDIYWETLNSCDLSSFFHSVQKKMSKKKKPKVKFNQKKKGKEGEKKKD